MRKYFLYKKIIVKNSKKSRCVKKQEPVGLLSKLGIKTLLTPSSKIFYWIFLVLGDTLMHEMRLS